MIKKLSVVYLGMLLSSAALNACESNNQDFNRGNNEVPCTSVCCSENIDSQESGSFVRPEVCQQEKKDAKQLRNKILKGVGIGAAAVTGTVGFSALGLATYARYNFGFWPWSR